MAVDLSGRTAIVTGAGRGIGKEIALTLAEAGADVVAAARTESELVRTVDEVRELGRRGLAVPTDLTLASDVRNLVETAVDEFGAPQILINNAGVNPTAFPLDQPVEDIDLLLEVNMRGTILLTQEFWRAFRESSNESGRIVNIASVAGQLGIPAMTVYGGTKSGISGITRGFAVSCASDGITVNSVTPGLIGVDRIEGLIEEKGDELYDLDRIPLERIGQPEDVADACLFLSSDLAGYVTGEDLRVDGGVCVTAGLYK